MSPLVPGILVRLQMRFETGIQSRDIVVLGIVGAGEQRLLAFMCRIEDRLPCVGMVVQLLAIASLDLGPLGRVMIEPFAEWHAGCDIAQPGVELGGFLFHPPRPKHFHQQPLAV